MSLHQHNLDKIISAEKARDIIQKLRASGKKVVFTNGCFDILHPGHVDYLSRARDLGDFLVLGLNTDKSVKSLEKAPNRPINDEQSRAMVLAGLSAVDLIVLFDETTPQELITTLLPDILVKGDDYQVHQIAGHDTVLSHGGKVITVPLLPGYSTTGLIRKITG